MRGGNLAINDFGYLGGRAGEFVNELLIDIAPFLLARRLILSRKTSSQIDNFCLIDASYHEHGLGSTTLHKIQTEMKSSWLS